MIVFVVVCILCVAATVRAARASEALAASALKVANQYRDHAHHLARLIEAGIITSAMLDGHRPVVTKPAPGMTMAEAQAHIDRIWADLQFEPKPGDGGERN